MVSLEIFLDGANFLPGRNSAVFEKVPLEEYHINSTYLGPYHAMRTAAPLSSLLNGSEMLETLHARSLCFYI